MFLDRPPADESPVLGIEVFDARLAILQPDASVKAGDVGKLIAGNRDVIRWVAPERQPLFGDLDRIDQTDDL
jgi:hypothetical protein